MWLTHTHICPLCAVGEKSVFAPLDTDRRRSPAHLRPHQERRASDMGGSLAAAHENNPLTNPILEVEVNKKKSFHFSLGEGTVSSDLDALTFERKVRWEMAEEKQLQITWREHIFTGQ